MSYDPIPLGQPERVNADMAGDQQYLSAALLSNRETVVVWQSPHEDFAGEFAPVMRVMVQRLDASGNQIGAEIVVHQDPDFDPSNNPSTLYPKVVALDGGGYAVAFVDHPLGGAARIRVKIYDNADTQIADTIIPNPSHDLGNGTLVGTTHNSTGIMTPIALEGGGLAIAWAAGYTGVTGSYAGQTTNYVQRLTSTGALDGTAVQFTPWVASVSYSQDLHDWTSDAVALSGGGFAVVYRGGMSSPSNPTGEPVVMVQTFGSDGQPDASPFVINPDLAEAETYQHSGRIAALEGGGYVAIWYAGSLGIQGQLFDAAFSPVGAAFQAMPLASGSGASSVSATPDGGFIVTTYRGGYSSYVSALRYDADGNPVGEVFNVAGRPLYPGVSDFGGSFSNSPGEWVFTEGGTGLFFIVGSASASSVTGSGYDSWLQRFAAQLFGTEGDDTRMAGDAATVIYGMGGNDSLEGGGGNDTLHAGAGVDTLTGGGGADSFAISPGDGHVQITDYTEGTDTLNWSAFSATDLAARTTLASREGWLQYRMPDGTTVTLEGVSGPVVNSPPTGLPVITGTARMGQRLIADSTAIDDLDGMGTLSYQWFANGTAIAGATAASFTPGAAQLGRSITVRVSWTDGHGTDESVTSAATAAVALAPITGTGGADRLTGTAGNDMISGLGGNDTLIGLAGNDRLIGGVGADLLKGGVGADTLSGGGGNDVANGGGGNDVLLGLAGRDTLTGLAGNDRLSGGGLADVLNGGGGNDRLSGGAGRDRLDGGRGADRLTGDAGGDSFVFARGFGRDVITDFDVGEGDVLRLSSRLWTGQLDADAVVDRFGSLRNGDAVLDFGGGNVITLDGVATLNGLADHIVIF